MKRILLILMMVFMTACKDNGQLDFGGGGASVTTPDSSTPATPPAPPVQGQDLSGTYRAQEMDCFDPGLTTVQSTSPFVVSGLYSDTLVIDGATFTDTVVISNQWMGCTTQEVGVVQFLTNVEVTGQQITHGCNQVLKVANTGTPADYQDALYSFGEALGNINDTYLVSGNDLWMPGYFGIGSQSSSCFIRYHKN